MKRKFKRKVFPIMFCFCFLALIIGGVFLSVKLTGTDGYIYSTNIMKDRIKAVMEDDSSNINSNVLISKPVSDDINIEMYYYSKNDEQEKQERSLILYENTYLPSTGILYSSENNFEVKSVFDGKVIEVREDEILGNYVSIAHNNNFKTYYYGLDKINVSVNDVVTNNTVIGISKVNNIIKDKQTILFEVYYKGNLINPEDIFNKNITEYE